ncbi:MULTISPECIES: protein-tyrosine phosphatase family protein [unclassified Sphingopyxis]|uniref:protein-tyrosine phosphatase family protein n=1 Tax=unclassified Sphingopyxis TaxID=2614943 RepID=UPI000736160A|nr:MULTISPECIES: dual specificity protein phosphatase family protein [unclassified Sphingopyxis]KTE30485.1 hypothetical protein ATE62_20440 [Sphingopyxis sp. HIX]KTE79266.1 hypothetical protein ATE72_19240 [Sphingopyxis sp. HXXIV]
MLSDIYWIETSDDLRLAIMARPRSGEWLRDEVAHWRRSGVEIVISLLEREEVDDLDLGREKALCERNGIEFLSWPIPDRGLPESRAAFKRFANEVSTRRKPVAIHCRAGIGRSAVLAAAMMIDAGQSADDALRAISAARGVQVPDTDEQRDWIRALDDH